MSRFHRFDFPDLPAQAFRTRGPRWVGRPATYEGGGSSAPPPDPRLVQAQIDSLGIQNNAIQQIEQISAQEAPLQQQQLQASVDATNQALKQSQSNYDYTVAQRSKLTPLQDQMISDANSFSSGDMPAQLVRQSGADVEQAFNQQRQSNAMDMARYGVNPSSGASMALNNSTNIAEAEAKAQGASTARTQARQEGYALTDRAANALAGYPAQALSATGQEAGIAAQGVSTTNAGVAGTMQGDSTVAGMAGSMGSQAGSAYNAQAGLYTNSQDNNTSAMDGTLGALGSAAGTALAVY